jgi:hypothetical protein
VPGPGRWGPGSTYEKSGLNGRASFCAFFLEDLLPPQALEVTREGKGPRPAALPSQLS